MAETTPNSGQTSTPSSGLASPNSQGQASPSGGGFQVPTGHRLVAESDWAAAERNREVAAGSKAFWEKAKSFGITKPEDFDRYGPALRTLSEKKIDPDMFSRAFSREADVDLAGEPKGFDSQKFEKDLESKFERRLAEKDYEALSAKEKDYVETALRDLLGDDEVDEYTKFEKTQAIQGWLRDNRELYPKGHPLHDSHLQPANEGLAKKAVEFFKAEKAKYAGSAMKAKADAVVGAKKPSPTAAGSSGKQGKPQNDSTKRTAKNEIEDAVDEAMSRK